MSVIFEDSNLLIDRVVVGPLENNVFTIRCKNTGEAVLIDAADEDDILLEICNRLGVNKVVTTHGHFDHIGAVVPLRNSGIEISIHENDSSMLPTYDLILNDEEIINVGNLKVEIMHTPGHTPGSVSLQLLGTPFLFTGDTLFPGGPGATHFPGGNFETIMESIINKLMAKPDDTFILPGHGNFSNIETEKPNIDLWINRGW